MTTQELIDYYAKLLILQYLGQPRAFATIQALSKMAVIDQIPVQVRDAFNLDDAFGVQLDVVGKYAGVSRNGITFTGSVTLDDDEFRVLIRLAIARNTAGSSLSEIQDLIKKYFENQMFVFDHLGMRMSFYVDSDFGSLQLVQLFLIQGLFPKPMGVQLSSLIYFPDLTHFFGFRTYFFAAVNVEPFNEYADYQLTRPWLSYAFAVAT